MNDKPKLDRGTFYSQFHNLDKHHDSSNYSRKEWYEWDESEAREGRADGGSVDADNTEMVPLSDHFK
jgi:hypothetical protein